MSWFTAPRLRAQLGGGRWLSPRAEQLLVDVLAVLVGIAGELSLLYNDDAPVRPVPVLLTVTAGLALFGRRRHPLLVLAAMLATTGLLFALGEVLLHWLLSFSKVQTIYGASTALVLLLLFVFYS